VFDYDYCQHVPIVFGVVPIFKQEISVDSYWIILPVFVSVFAIRILPRVVLAPVALVFILVERWYAAGKAEEEFAKVDD
jgi:hypothetical protein